MTDPLVAGDLSSAASLRPAAAVFVPAVAALLLVAFRDRRGLRDAWAILATLATFGIVAGTAPALLAGRIHVTDLGQIAPNVAFVLRTDPLGLAFATVAAGLYLVAVPFSVGYLRRFDSGAGTRYLACLLASLAATMGIALAGNLLALFLFFELFALATYPLVAHDETRKARRAGYEYLAYVFSGGLLTLVGMRVVYWLSGTLAFTPGGIPDLATAAAADPWIGRVAFALLFAGFGIRAGLLPLYAWLTSAAVAPTPAFGLVFAVVVLKAGAFGIVRTVLEVFGPATVAALGVAGPAVAIAAATILVANLMAIRTRDLLGRASYATIAGSAYVVLGVATLAPTAVAGAIVHLAVHAVGTLAMFLVVCVLRIERGVVTVEDLAGVGHRLPLSMAVFAVAAASLAGVPLLSGFVGKWYLLFGSASADLLVPAVVLVVSGLFHVAYLLPIVAAAFFESPDGVDPAVTIDRSARSRLRADGGDGDDGGSRGRTGWLRPGTPPLFLWPLLATGAFLVVFGLVPDRLFFVDAARLAVEAAMGVSVP